MLKLFLCDGGEGGDGEDGREGEGEAVAQALENQHHRPPGEDIKKLVLDIFQYLATFGHFNSRVVVIHVHGGADEEGGDEKRELLEDEGEQEGLGGGGGGQGAEAEGDRVDGETVDEHGLAPHPALAGHAGEQGEEEEGEAAEVEPGGDEDNGLSTTFSAEGLVPLVLAKVLGGAGQQWLCLTHPLV